jgi:flavin-dependent thymidylate synthase
MPGQNNQVELIGTYGGDETHALSAWTSTSRELNPEKRGRMEKLLAQLARDGHHTPFEKSTIHFLVTTEIATHIQIIKHRIGVPFNAESARYKELKDDKFYLPVDWDQEDLDLYSAHMEQCFDRYHETVERLVKKGMTRKRAKESARFYIPYGNQLTADVMFNFRSFNHFLGLRYSNHAQLEIRNLASSMLEQVVKNGGFEMTLRAFGYTDVNGNIRLPSE